MHVMKKSNIKLYGQPPRAGVMRAQVKMNIDLYKKVAIKLVKQNLTWQDFLLAKIREFIC